MSEVTAAAEAMGVPEALVERSARARAEATGQSYEAILAAWAGGEAVSAPAAPEPEAAEAVEEAPAEERAVPTEEAAPEPVPTEPAPSMPDVRPRPAARPPILEGPADRPLTTVAGGIGVVLLVLLLGVVFPSLGDATGQIRSSEIPYTEEARTGRGAYLQAGCASCHTQMVRSVVADVGLGAVTLMDTNQVAGYRRLGPDLSDVGTRLEAAEIAAVVTGPSHPPVALSEGATRALVTYLSESATSPPGSDVDGDIDEDEPDSEAVPDDETGDEGAEE